MGFRDENDFYEQIRWADGGMHVFSYEVRDDVKKLFIDLETAFHQIESTSPINIAHNIMWLWAFVTGHEFTRAEKNAPKALPCCRRPFLGSPARPLLVRWGACEGTTLGKPPPLLLSEELPR